MKTLRVLSVFAFLFGTVSANARQQTPELRDLTDYLSPEELVEEFGIVQDVNQFFWKSSAENPRLQIIVDKANAGKSPNAQTLEAYVDGTLAFRFKVSTGKEVPIKTTSGSMSSRRTPVGTFRIHTRSRNHVSKTWVGASMPFAQFFNGGIAIHATVPSHFAQIGTRDSGGCVRLMPADAKTMWQLVGNIGVEETTITVFDGSQTMHPLMRGTEAPVLTVEPPADPNSQQLDDEFEIEASEREAVKDLNKRELERIKKMMGRST